MTTSSPVLFSTLPCQRGKHLAIATLNAPQNLNALTMAMVEQLYRQLLAWQEDASIAAVFLQGSGERAFCAGGDVKRVYECATAKPGGPCREAEDFFAREYRLDYLMHRYRKPIICWGHGIVMGGGLGLHMACSHRVATETSRMAMPEITIALYPDVGGNYFLQRTPGNCGLFLALTAAQVNATDCLFLGFADHFIEHDKKAQVLQTLQTLPWSDDPQRDDRQLKEVLDAFRAYSQTPLPPANVETNLETIQSLTQHRQLADIVDAITGYNGDVPWLQKAAATLAKGSPLSACNIYQALQATRTMSLAEVFRFELMLSTNVVRHPEFAEGVRAQLIDKDRQPKWLYRSVNEVPQSLLQQMLRPPWAENPLSDLA